MASGRPDLKYGTLFQRPRNMSLLCPLSSKPGYGYTLVWMCARMPMCGCLYLHTVFRSRRGCTNRREANSRSMKESLDTRRKTPDEGWNGGGVPLAPVLQVRPMAPPSQDTEWNSSLGDKGLGGEAPAWVQSPYGVRKEGPRVEGEASRTYRDDIEMRHSTLGTADPWSEPEAVPFAPGSLIKAYRSCLNPTAT